MTPSRTESPEKRGFPFAFLLSLVGLYLPLALQLLLDRDHWDSEQLSPWILATPGMSLVVLLYQETLLPGDWEPRFYLGAGAALTGLAILLLWLLCRRKRTGQISAVVLALGLGGTAAWVNWSLQRSW